jgi:hydrogenase/urease accessory protein HupE
VIRWLALLLLCLGTATQADELRPGYIEFTQKNVSVWSLIWKAPIKGGITPSTQPVLPIGCSILETSTRSLGNAAVVTKIGVTCTRPISGQRIGLTDMSASQTDVLVRVAPLDRPVQTLRLTAANPTAEIRAKPDRWQVVQIYFTTGVEHIMFGYDHLLFVISLVLLLSGAWTIAKAVTAFTVAHSITLIGTTLGMIGLPQRPVESVIALSIVFLAVEIVKKEPGHPRLSERIPWAIAFLFGLLHGFGFAGALKQIGLPESDVPTALLSFNLGVEAGQLIIVAASVAALALLRRFMATLIQPAILTVTYFIGIVASSWFIARTFA